MLSAKGSTSKLCVDGKGGLYELNDNRTFKDINMKALFISLCLLLQASPSLAGAEDRFGAIKAFSETCFHVGMKVPEGYVAEYDRCATLYLPNADSARLHNGRSWKGTCAYWLVATNKDADSKILYPWLPAHVGGNAPREKVLFHDVFRYTENNYLTDLHSAAFLGFGHDEEKPKVEPSWAERITKFGGKEAASWGNADSVYVVDFPITTTFEARYTHCIGVYMAKQGYVPVFLKLLLTDEGYAQKEQRLRGIKESIVFMQDAWSYDPQKVRSAQEDLLKRIGRW